MRARHIVNDAGRAAIEVTVPDGDRVTFHERDEDGDVVVTFSRASRPGWRLAEHAQNAAMAAAFLSDVVAQCEEMDDEEREFGNG